MALVVCDKSYLYSLYYHTYIHCVLAIYLLKYDLGHSFRVGYKHMKAYKKGL